MAETTPTLIHTSTHRDVEKNCPSNGGHPLHISSFLNIIIMVQGKTKGLHSKAPRRPTKAATNLKKGRKYIAPKKPALVKQASVHKDLSTKINRSIEQQMVSAASSGKLTILKHCTVSEAPSLKGKTKP